MSHLDTAYQLGVKKAEEDFQAELNKSAQGNLPDLSGGTAPPTPGQGAKPVPAPPVRTQPVTPPPSATQLPSRGTGTRVPPPVPTR
jgi:hypothetical protein